jgi:membrane protein implicated in regulation of membrane protease activity
MNVLAMLDSGPWLWLTAGILLCAAETLAPGMFLLWIGLAAFATGLTAFAVTLGFEWTLIVFGLYAVLSLLVGRRFYGSRASEGDRPFLNRRADVLVGQMFFLERAIQAGEGRIKVNDSVWRVRGPDLPAGAKVLVTGVEEGVLLRVEPA